jgi:hypothetical protein
VTAKDAPDRARRDANAKASKLALDADTGPAPVLSGEPDDDFDEERSEYHLDLSREMLDQLLQEVELGEDRGDDERVTAREATLERAFELSRRKWWR